MTSHDAGRDLDTHRSWRGIVIAESLSDPTLINDCPVYRAEITADGLPVDDGRVGRWHLYWVRLTDPQLDRIGGAIRPGWYAHFWRDDHLVVCFERARFDVHRRDRETWRAAIDHGLSQGLRPEWLDFPTDDTAGTLDGG